MRSPFLLVVLLLTLVGAFVSLNWPAIQHPGTLNLGLVDVQAPLGLVLLALLLLVTLAFLSYLAWWRGQVLLDSRRLHKDLTAQRELADRAEASRFTELQRLLQVETQALAQKIERNEAALRAEMRDSANSLAAMLGEIDDRMKQPQRPT